MYKQGDSSIRQKWTDASVNKFYSKVADGFYLNTWKRFPEEVFLKPAERSLVPLKAVLGIFKVALRLRKF